MDIKKYKGDIFIMWYTNPYIRGALLSEGFWFLTIGLIFWLGGAFN
jgi:hypothetical protein